MQWKVAGVLGAIGVFVGCGAAPDDPAPGATGVAPGDIGEARSAASCLSYTATIADHVAAGRVTENDLKIFIWTFRSYYTTGPNSQTVGSSPSQVVTLYPRTGGGYTTDASLCQAATCGNGVLESPAEDCDGTLFGGGTAPQCYSFGGPNGGYISGLVKCSAGCKYDLSDCKTAVCGDGKRDVTEECDGQDLGGVTTCQQDTWDGAFTGGVLKCKGDCTFDTSGCTGTCGNGTLDPGEDCDGTARTAQYAGKTCADFNAPWPTWPFAFQVRYSPGPINCDRYCHINLMQTCAIPPGCYYEIVGGTQPSAGVVCH